jgi:hypothetical protein
VSWDTVANQHDATSFLAGEHLLTLRIIRNTHLIDQQKIKLKMEVKEYLKQSSQLGNTGR